MIGNLHFRRLRLRNWRNFTGVEVAIQDRLILIGPNASGKSNFLDVFRFLRDLAASGGGFQEAVARRGGVSTIRCLAARRQSDVEIGVELTEGKGGSQWNYELGFHQDQQRRLWSARSVSCAIAWNWSNAPMRKTTPIPSVSLKPAWSR